MAKAPLSRIVILTEDGSTVRPKEMVTIPPRIPSLTNTLGSSDIPLNKIRGGVEAFDLLDMQLQKLGWLMANKEAAELIKSILDSISNETTLATIVGQLQSVINVMKTLPPAPDLTTTLGSSSYLPRQVRGAFAAMTEVVAHLKNKGFLR